MNTLSTISFGLEKLPPRIILYGVHGIGKSSFVARHQEKYKPIFIQTENGLRTIKVPKFPLCVNYNMFCDQLLTLLNEEHQYKTLVIDSIDWLEKLIQTFVCEEGGKESIADFGFGRGYELVRNKINKICDILNEINEKKKMVIVLIAHADIKTFQNPMGEPYDRYQIKLQEKTARVFEEWCDCEFFVNYETHVKKDSKDNNKGIGKGERVLYTSETPAFKAKNRYDLAAKIKFDFDFVMSEVDEFFNKLVDDDINY